MNTIYKIIYLHFKCGLSTTEIAMILNLENKEVINTIDAELNATKDFEEYQFLYNEINEKENI